MMVTRSGKGCSVEDNDHTADAADAVQDNDRKDDEASSLCGR